MKTVLRHEFGFHLSPLFCCLKLLATTTILIVLTENGMSKKTVLHDTHVAMGGKIVPFGGWDMPINYGSQIDEHHVVRQKAGMFDVSHMTVVDLTGESVKDMLRKLLANDVIKLTTPGKALYSCMLTPEGTVIDDLITYYMNDEWYRIVVNAATRDKDLPWIKQYADLFRVTMKERDDLAMIAVQGPDARVKAAQHLPAPQDALNLKVFSATEMGDLFVARTGYTGEDGFEIMVPQDDAVALWNKFADNGIAPCGLGARDTLRLEAGMNLYGTDMDESYTPLESGLGWTIAWEPPTRDFVGRKALETIRANKDKSGDMKLVGLVLEGRGVLRGHQKVLVAGEGEGEITSGTFSPTMEIGIAMARVPAGTGDRCMVEIRGKEHPARVVKLPFVRNGKVKV